MAKNVSIKKILGQLEAGVSREEISVELELNPREAKVLWQHPALKGIKKSKYKVELNIVEEDGEQLAAEEIANDNVIDKL